MLNQYHDLQYINADKFSHIAMPAWDNNINLDSPATSAMIDFRLRPMSYVSPAVPVDEAKHLMDLSHVNLQFVIDEGVYQGIVSLRYLQSRKVMVKMQELGVKREEITVGDVMLPKSRAHALCYDAVKNARIGDVLHTLKSLGETYVIVVDRDEDDADIVGIISAIDIAQVLNVPFELFQSEKTFLSLVKILNRNA